MSEKKKNGEFEEQSKNEKNSKQDVNKQREDKNKNLSNSKKRKNKKTKIAKNKFYIFPEDVVMTVPKKRKNRKKKYDWNFGRTGIVQSVGGDIESGYESDSELEEEEVRVQFMNDQRERILKKSKVIIQDRSFQFGDIVKMSSDYPSGQSGTVSNVRLFVDIQFLENCKNINEPSCAIHVVEKIPSHLVRPIWPFQIKSLCVYEKKYVCFVRTIYYDLEMIFKKSNHKCVIRTLDPDLFFSEEDEERILDPSYPFRKSQTLKISRRDHEKHQFLRSAEWTGTSRFNMKIHKVGKILRVFPSAFDLRKVFTRPDFNNNKGSSNDDLEFFEKVSVKDVQPYQYFSYVNWGIGDTGYINYSEEKMRKKIFEFESVNNNNNNNIHLESNKKEFESTESCFSMNHQLDYIYPPKYFDLLKQSIEILDFDSSYSSISNFSKLVRITLTKTFVDVQWQNGEISENIEATKLYPFQHVEKQDFFPGDTVRFKSFEKFGNSEELKKDNLGTIVSVDHKQTICKVLGFHNSEVSEVSSFEISQDDSFQFSLCDNVVNLSLTHNQLETTEKIGNNNNVNNDLNWSGEVISVTPKEIGVFWISSCSLSSVSSKKRDELDNLAQLGDEVLEEEMEGESASSESGDDNNEDGT